ncbi:MAG: hypothetical protein U9R03_03960 [Candidatus Aerophobetes bacterium]|nr:hypothetical protein [Candidatus Aerophobetes bacterium]
MKARGRKTVIDPGLALGYERYGLLPHPAQVAVGEEVRRAIITALKDATDIVISHFHGDHIPFVDANPYQLKTGKVVDLCQTPQIWAKGLQGLSYNMRHRAEELSRILNKDLVDAEGKSDRLMKFSRPMPHGKPNTRLGTVMMTCIKDENDTFVHASDIQLLNEEAVLQILNWQPTIVLAGGPPLYLPWLSYEDRKNAWNNALQLAKGVNTLILDHHLLRCKRGLSWLDHLSSESGHRVICAADFMRRPRHLLEADRRWLYKCMPVPKGWHQRYALGIADTKPYQDYIKRRKTY